MRNYSKGMDWRMFDFAEFYSSVAETLKDNAVIAEVGVSAGTSSIYLVEELLNRRRKVKFYMIDSLDYGKTEQLEEIIGNVCKANLGSYVTLLPFDSLNASCRFPDGHFDFVFLDSSHRFESTKAEIRCWYPKIKEGGILAGHDYNEEEVGMAVNLVVPKTFQRPPIPEQEQTFPIEQLLHVETTEKGYGVWWLKKKFYVRLE